MFHHDTCVCVCVCEQIQDCIHEELLHTAPPRKGSTKRVSLAGV